MFSRDRSDARSFGTSHASFVAGVPPSGARMRRQKPRLPPPAKVGYAWRVLFYQSIATAVPHLTLVDADS